MAKLTHRFENVNGSVSVEELEIISVSKKKYDEVLLCIKSNMNIPFATIKLYNSNLAIDAAACFESAEALGKEIERRWQLQDEQLQQLQQIEQLQSELAEAQKCYTTERAENNALEMKVDSLESKFVEAKKQIQLMHDNGLGESWVEKLGLEKCKAELEETKFALDVERNDNDRLREALNKRKLKGAQT